MLTRLVVALLMMLLSSADVSAASEGTGNLKQALARRHATIAREASPSADSHARGNRDDSATTETPNTNESEEVRHTSPAPASPGADHVTVAHPAAEPAMGEAAVSPEGVWEDLLRGNMRFIMGEPQPRLLISSRQRLVYGQHPKAIILTCSDSRVCPELLFDKGLGDLFVVRTAGNVADPVALGSIEYAAQHLHATLLVVLGHEKCGAVAAAASGEAMPTPNLEAIVSRIAPAIERARGGAAGDELIHLGVEGNVHQSALDVIANSTIIREAIATGELIVIKAVYDLKTGQVTTLPEAYPS